MNSTLTIRNSETATGITHITGESTAVDRIVVDHTTDPDTDYIRVAVYWPRATWIYSVIASDWNRFARTYRQRSQARGIQRHHRLTPPKSP
jgi:hypothetical protein